jgi:hypothetical protein
MQEGDRAKEFLTSFLSSAASEVTEDRSGPPRDSANQITVRTGVTGMMKVGG